jgi:hypothetical protein
MVRRRNNGVCGFHTLAHTRPEHPEITQSAHHHKRCKIMELLGILLFGLWVLIVTVCVVLTDGRGHTPEIRSTDPWSAGNLPSEPYASLRM